MRSFLTIITFFNCISLIDIARGVVAQKLPFTPQAVSEHLQALHREQISLLPAASPPV